tara:strand:+ start:115 stop:501 length:387 start_codon:yes stop_codon:yes gene_type:complete
VFDPVEDVPEAAGVGLEVLPQELFDEEAAAEEGPGVLDPEDEVPDAAGVGLEVLPQESFEEEAAGAEPDVFSDPIGLSGVCEDEEETACVESLEGVLVAAASAAVELDRLELGLLAATKLRGRSTSSE